MSFKWIQEKAAFFSGFLWIRRQPPAKNSFCLSVGGRPKQVRACALPRQSRLSFELQFELCDRAFALQVQQWQAQIEARKGKDLKTEPAATPHRPSGTSEDPESQSEDGIYEPRYPRRVHTAPVARKDSPEHRESSKPKRPRSTTSTDRSLNEGSEKWKTSSKKTVKRVVKGHELATANDTTEQSAASDKADSEARAIALFLQGLSAMQHQMPQHGALPAPSASHVQPASIFNFSFNVPHGGA